MWTSTQSPPPRPGGVCRCGDFTTDAAAAYGLLGAGIFTGEFARTARTARAAFERTAGDGADTSEEGDAHDR